MENLKEVYFHCNLCIHEKVDENPCCICLSIPARESSHRPEYFKPKETKGEKDE